MRRIMPSLLVLVALTLGTPHARANSLWDTVGQVMRTACGATYTFNVGSNWAWLCTLRKIYGDIRWLIENFNEYALDIVVQMFTGAFEGMAQQLGWVMGPGVNQFFDDLAGAVRDIRRAPYKLRNLIVKAAIDEAKQKYLPLTGAPPGTPRASLNEKAQESPSLAWGFIGEFARKVKEGWTQGALMTQMAENAQAVQETSKAVEAATEQALLVLPPKEAEPLGLDQGIADALVDEAQTAASAREVMEVMVKGVANLLKLQAAGNQAIIGQLTNTLKTQLLTNGSLITLYDKFVEEAERQASEAISELEVWASAIDEEVYLAGQEVGLSADVFAQIGDMADNTPNLGDFLR